MGKGWTAQDHERCLMAILDTHKIDMGVVADRWSKKYRKYFISSRQPCMC
jgi:hypothetical protein